MTDLDHIVLRSPDVERVGPLDWAAEIAAGPPVHTGPVPRFGARGEATSAYLNDPDGNEIELRHCGAQA